MALVILPTLLLILHRQIGAQTVTEHPYIDPGEIKTETCLGCHPANKEGKFVHSAVASGCERCHQATSEKEKKKTTVTLMAQGGELCAMCHEVKQDVVVHKPYRAGQCLVCHDPHSSNFPKQTRAETNTLCMSCHGENQPDVKINKETQTVSLLGGRRIGVADYDLAPKLALEQAGTCGHPMMGHPITVKDPRHKDTALGCLSCHVPHSSALANLMLAEVKSPTGLCQ